MAQEAMVRMDDDLSLRLHEVCDEIGLPVSVAFLIFAKRVVRDRKIPFERTASTLADPFYSESNIAHLHRGMEAFKSGNFKRHDLIELAEDA